MYTEESENIQTEIHRVERLHTTNKETLNEMGYALRDFGKLLKAICITIIEYLEKKQSVVAPHCGL